jgi:hypothetical protein
MPLLDSVYVLTSKTKNHLFLEFAVYFFYETISSKFEKWLLLADDHLFKMRMIIQNTEGDAPSLQTLNKILDLIHGFKLVNYHQPFLIDDFYFLPLYLTIQRKSPFLHSSFQFLFQQC